MGPLAEAGGFLLDKLSSHFASSIFATFYLNLRKEDMPIALNNTQLEILKLFRHEQSEEDLKEIKSLLITYLADKVTREADKAFDNKGYSTAVFEQWKKDHFRKPTQL
jgi:hypothetical protein